MNTPQPATKGDVREAIAELEARQDAKIDASTRRLSLAIVDTNGRLQEFKEQLDKSVSHNADRILTALDPCSRITALESRPPDP